MAEASTPAALRAPILATRPLAVGDALSLDEHQMRQLELREVNVKEAFTVVDERGGFFRASLKAADKTSGGAVVYEQMARSTESPARITLLCAVLGRQRMLMVVQKATELGCVRVVPVLSEHAVQSRDLEKEKPWAWPGQAIRACRQCRRASVPEVLKATTLDAALAAAYWRDARARFVLDDRAAGDRKDPFAAPATATATSCDYVLAVGPEGGWSAPERERLDAGGALELALGGRVLRAETAAYAGLALLQHRLGDMRGG